MSLDSGEVQNSNAGGPSHRAADKVGSMIPPSSIVLAPDLEAYALSRFDEAVAAGKLIYGPSTAETIDDNGFKVRFRGKPPMRLLILEDSPRTDLIHSSSSVWLPLLKRNPSLRLMPQKGRMGKRATHSCLRTLKRLCRPLGSITIYC